MANDSHFAILVGLWKYPQLGEPPPSDLKGPEKDIEAVRQWLVDPNGGGLLPENVFVARSPDPTPAQGAPRSYEIQDLFAELAKRAEAKRTGLGAQLGERLYVYASGHGFSPRLNQGCLHAGDASSFSSGANVFCTGWIDQFREAGYFRETVLWMDCCMNRDSTDVPALPTVKPKTSSDPAGPGFVAFAARRPLLAVEKMEADGQVHGLFTTVLLEGLRGAAANKYGIVTGRSLADWLRNAQRGRMLDEDLKDPRVSKEPEIIREDPDLVFGRGIAVKRYKVALQFPPGTATCRLWSLRPPRPEAITLPPDGRIERELAPGLYLVDAPLLGLRQGFQVTSDLEVEVKQTGLPVSPTEDLVDLSIQGQEPGSEVFIVDESFTLVDRAVERLSAKLPFGLYKVRVRAGRQMTEDVHLLDKPLQPAQAVVALDKFSSPAPIPGTALTHEYHQWAVQQAFKRRDIIHGSGSSLLLVAREQRPDDTTPSTFQPWAGVTLVDQAGTKIADMSVDGVRGGSDPIGTLSVDVAPGSYFVRVQAEDGRIHEQCLVACADWVTQLHLLRAPLAKDFRESIPTRVAMFMSRAAGSDPLDPLNVALERARVALADERLVMGKELQDLLIAKFDNPLAGIIGGHLLLVDHARNATGRIEQLNAIVGNLRGLVGTSHPDVEALSLRCPDRKLRSREGFLSPPMFAPSWTILVEESRDRPEIISKALWLKVHAMSPLPPFLAWRVDARSKEQSLKSLRSVLLGEATEGRGEAAARPASATVTKVAAKKGARPASLGGRRMGRKAPPAHAKPARPVPTKAPARTTAVGPRLLKERLAALGLPPAAAEALRGGGE